MNKLNLWTSHRSKAKPVKQNGRGVAATMPAAGADGDYDKWLRELLVFAPKTDNKTEARLYALTRIHSELVIALRVRMGLAEPTNTSDVKYGFPPRLDPTEDAVFLSGLAYDTAMAALAESPQVSSAEWDILLEADTQFRLLSESAVSSMRSLRRMDDKYAELTKETKYDLNPHDSRALDVAREQHALLAKVKPVATDMRDIAIDRMNKARDILIEEEKASELDKALVKKAEEQARRDYAARGMEQLTDEARNNAARAAALGELNEAGALSAGPASKRSSSAKGATFGISS